MAQAVDSVTLALDAAFDGAVDGVQKIVAMRLDVESYQVGTENSIEKFMLPRTDAEGFRVRPRDVPEDGDVGFGHPFFDHAGQQREMVVLHENDGTLLAGGLFEERL